jgi:hypothetical protein
VLIASQRIKILKQTGIKGNVKPALAQHAKATLCRNGIQVQTDKLAREIVQKRNTKLAWRKTKLAHQVRLKANNIGSVNSRKIQNGGVTDQHPWKPSGIVIGDDVFVSHRLRLPILVQRWDLLSCLCLIGHGGEGSRRRNLALHSNDALSTGRRDITCDVGGLISFTRQGGEGGGEAQ